MITDPSWLYSTIAQCSAAIVAIVGGFITASVLMLMSEKRNLTNQKMDKETRLQTLRNEKEKLSEELDAKEVQLFLESIIDELISAEEIPSLEELMQNHPEMQNSNLEILKQEYGRFYKQIFEARNFIRKRLSKSDVMEAVTFEEWVGMRDLDISAYDYGILEKEYNRQEEKQASLLSENEKQIRATRLSGIIPLRTPYIPSVWDQRELESLREKLNEVKYEISALEGDVISLGFRISKFSYPPNLGWGVGVLGYLAVFGILFPVFMIWVELYSDIARKLTIYSFYGGIVGLFAYIASQIVTLRRK